MDDNPTAAPHPNINTPRKPSRGWYGLAFIVLLIGVAAFTASLNVAKMRVAERLDAMQRFVIPGSTQVTLEKPGRYLIYYEKIGQHHGEDFDTSERFPELPKIDLDVVLNHTGQYLTIEHASSTETQIFNHGRANSEFAFTRPPGNTNTPGSRNTPEGNLENTSQNAVENTPDAKSASGHLASADALAADASAGLPQTVTIITRHENDFDDRLLFVVGPPVVGDLMTGWRGPFGGAAALAFAFVLSALTVLLTWLRRHGDVTTRDD